MANNTLIFFQKLINNPTLSKKQREKILDMRKKFLNPFSISTISEKKLINVTSEDLYNQSINVAKLLSKFDRGNEYGIILHPIQDDESAFAKMLPSIQAQLINDVHSTPIPKTLKALLFLFVLGKYGTYTQWIGGGGKKYSITCSSKIVKELCLNTHPLNVPEISREFKQFENAITVNGYIVNKLLDIFEEVYCRPNEILNERIDHCNKNQMTTVNSEQHSFILGKNQRTVKRSNLDNVYFHTNTNIFRTAMVWLLIIIAKHTPDDSTLWISYEEKESMSFIIVKHKLIDINAQRRELVEIQQKISLIIPGYAELIAEGYFKNKIEGKEIGPRRLYLVSHKTIKSEAIEYVDDCITYRFCFHKE